jgi:hypothetical protein
MDAPGAESHIPLDFESALKHAAAVLAGCYATGLVITNIFLGDLGAPDFSDLRPRAILVGIAFAIYVAAPVALVAMPITTWKLSRRWLASAAPRVIISIAVFVVLIPAIAFPFEWALASPRVCGFIEQTSRFWNDSYGTIQWHHVVLVIIPAIVLLWRDSIVMLPQAVRRCAILLVVFGTVCQIMPFARYVYPLISAGVGGGQPELVEISLRRDARTLAKDGHYLLWHASPEVLVLTRASPGPIDHTYLVTLNSLQSMVRLPAHVMLDDMSVKEIRTHSTAGYEQTVNFPRNDVDGRIQFSADTFAWSEHKEGPKAILQFNSVRLTNLDAVRRELSIGLAWCTVSRSYGFTGPSNDTRPNAETAGHQQLPGRFFVEPDQTVSGQLIFEVPAEVIDSRTALAFSLTDAGGERPIFKPFPSSAGKWKVRTGQTEGGI